MRNCALLLLACSASASPAAWEARWQEARACLAGDRPGTAAQAAAIRLLAGDTVTSCKLGSLDAIPLDTDADRAIAKAATDLARASDELAAAKGDHRRAAEDGFVDAIAALETARAALFPPANSLPAATIAPLHGIVSLEPPPIPSAGGVVMFGNTKTSGVQIVLPIGGAPRIAPVRVGVLRSVGEPTLGTVAEVDRARIGIVDEHGKMSDRALPVFDLVAGTDRRTTALVALGDGKASVFAIASATGLAVVRGSPAPHPDMHEVFDPDDFRMVLEPTVLTTRLGEVAFATDPRGYGAILWREDSDLHGELLVPGSTAPDVVLAHGGKLANEVCLANKFAWAKAGDYVIGFDNLIHGDAIPVPTFHVAACGEKGVLLRDGEHFLICQMKCKSVSVTAPPEAKPVLIDGKLARVAVRDGVLAVYRDKPTYYAVPGAVRLELAMSDDRTLDVVASTRDGYVLARVTN